MGICYGTVASTKTIIHKLEFDCSKGGYFNSDGVFCPHSRATPIDNVAMTVPSSRHIIPIDADKISTATSSSRQLPSNQKLEALLNSSNKSSDSNENRAAQTMLPRPEKINIKTNLEESKPQINLPGTAMPLTPSRKHSTLAPITTKQNVSLINSQLFQFRSN